MTVRCIPAGVPTVRADLRAGDLRVSFGVQSVLEALPDDPAPGRQLTSEGDTVTLTVLPDGGLRFAHTDDPAWAEDEPGRVFVPIADDRWASAAARLRAQPVLDFDLARAEARIDAAGEGSGDAVHEEAAVLAQAFGGDWSAPVHQVGGTIYDGHDGVHAEVAERRGGPPADWHVLLALRAGGVREADQGDAQTLVVMMRANDIQARAWEAAVGLLV